jgi:hypothetical protein
MMAIRSFDESNSERDLMRMSARTILRLIHHLIQRRRAAGGSIALSHVRAHTTGMDEDSVGNRLADYQANLARLSTNRSYPQGMKPLPLAHCENWLHLVSSVTGRVVIDDIRRSARNQMQQEATVKWLRYSLPQGLLAGKGTADAGRIVLKHGSSEQQAAFVLVASNSIEYHWFTVPDGRSLVKPVQCATCACALSLLHLTICVSASSQSYRQRLQTAILDCLQANGVRPAWVATNRRHSLDRVLLRLFPPPSMTTATTTGVVDHFTRCFAGLFVENEAVAVLMSLDVSDRQAGHEVLRRLRLICLDHLARFYSNLKVPH